LKSWRMLCDMPNSIIITLKVNGLIDYLVV